MSTVARDQLTDVKWAWPAAPLCTPRLPLLSGLDVFLLWTPLSLLNVLSVHAID